MGVPFCACPCLILSLLGYKLPPSNPLGNIHWDSAPAIAPLCPWELAAAGGQGEERDALADAQQTPHRDRDQVAEEGSSLSQAFLVSWKIQERYKEDSKKIESLSAPSPGLGGQQQAALSRSSSTGSSRRGSQEKGTVLLLLPTLSLCPECPGGICAP